MARMRWLVGLLGLGAFSMNGVKDDNREANVQILTRCEHARLEAQRASEAGSDRWKKTGDTQGAPCEYNKGDGEGWSVAPRLSSSGFDTCSRHPHRSSPRVGIPT